jgi:predicted TIM-barrel fold metal-dependent hydrolase
MSGSPVLVSADSHVVEPPHCYSDYIDPKFRDRVPHLVPHDKGGDAYAIPGMPGLIQVGIIAAAGKDPSKVTAHGVPWDEVYPSSWDGRMRTADMDRDGVRAEVLYPTIGMVLCAHDDAEYKRACFRAYNRWLEEFVAAAPDRLFGLGQLAVLSVEQAIADVRDIHAQGFKGIMLPGYPETEFDFHDERFDPLWQVCADLQLPVSLHIAATTSRGVGADPKKLALEAAFSNFRGPKRNTTLNAIRPLQDAMGMFVLGEVFDRNPNLKLCCVEADAGWVPHFIQKMDWQYHRGRHWRGLSELKRLPSEYFRDHVYVTFQEDKVAMDSVANMNVDRLMWASDFPHNDSTWPHSREAYDRQTVNLTADQKDRIFRRNVIELYNLPL